MSQVLNLFSVTLEITLLPDCSDFAIRHGDPVFLNWLNLFIDQIKTDGTLDLLTHEYFEQMPWLEKNKGQEKTSRALFLKNKFIARQQEMIKRRREQTKTSKIIYD